MDFAKSLHRLEEIVSAMEGGQLSLEESLKLFEEGVQVSRLCQERLSEAEQKVKVLLKIDEEGRPITEDFSEQSEP